MAKSKSKLKAIEVSVEAKITKVAGMAASGKIIVKGKGIHKSIPAVLFTETETEALLEIVDKVEKDTNANIVYS